MQKSVKYPSCQNHLLCYRKSRSCYIKEGWGWCEGDFYSGSHMWPMLAADMPSLHVTVSIWDPYFCVPGLWTPSRTNYSGNAQTPSCQRRDVRRELGSEKEAMREQGSMSSYSVRSHLHADRKQAMVKGHPSFQTHDTREEPRERDGGGLGVEFYRHASVIIHSADRQKGCFYLRYSPVSQVSVKIQLLRAKRPLTELLHPNENVLYVFLMLFYTWRKFWSIQQTWTINYNKAYTCFCFVFSCTNRVFRFQTSYPQWCVTHGGRTIVLLT